MIEVRATLTARATATEPTFLVEVGFDASKVVKKGPGRIEFLVEKPSGNGILFKIKSQEPSDPIRNVRVWLPGQSELEATFNPRLLAALAPFRVIRFMDWQEINKLRAADATVISAVVFGVLLWIVRLFTRPVQHQIDCVIIPNGPLCVII